MRFAIDNIPSLADAMPYASYIVLYGDESDGIPEFLDDVPSKKPRWEPGIKVEIVHTKRIRRAR